MMIKSAAVVAVVIVGFDHKHEAFPHVLSLSALGTAAQVHVAGEHHEQNAASGEEAHLSVVAEVVKEGHQPRIAEVVRSAAVHVIETVDQVGI